MKQKLAGKKKHSKKTKKCFCPYCESELFNDKMLSCKPCGIEFVECDECGEFYSKSLSQCPYCE